MKMDKTCGECGNKNIYLMSIDGKSFPFKDYPAISIKSDLQLPTCTSCGNVMYNIKQAEKLDEEIKNNIISKVKAHIKTITDRGITQKDIASRLGITEVYLTEIKKGKKIPSFQTYNFLKVMALDKNVYDLSDPYAA